MKKTEANTNSVEWQNYLKRMHKIRMAVGVAAMTVLTIMVGLMFYYDFDIVLSIIMMGCWAIVVPAGALSMAAFARGCRLHTKYQWFFFVWFMVLAFFAAMYMFVVYPPLSGGMTTARYMEDNYDQNRLQFSNLTNYIENTMCEDCRLSAEWKKGSLEMLEVGTVETGNERRYSPSSDTRDSLLGSIGLDNTQLETLYKLVRKCDCTGIEVLRDGVRLGYRKVGYGEYFYFLPFDLPYTAQADMMYDIVPYNDSVFFEYAGGDEGPQEFPAEVKNHYVRGVATAYGHPTVEAEAEETPEEKPIKKTTR